MTSHRVNDLSYGHLGEATYDTEEKLWFFARNYDQRWVIQPIQQHATRCISPSLFVSKEKEEKDMKARRNIQTRQKRWLKVSLPETAIAESVLSSMSKSSEAIDSPASSTLLTVGRAVDIDHTHVSEARGITVFAMPHGAAGNALRLVKPQSGYLGWSNHASPKLQHPDFTATKDAYWVGGGGPIQQIVFAIDTETREASSWLAVRKAETISIFRPTYHRTVAPAVVEAGLANNYPSSRLRPNLLLTIHNTSTGTKVFEDVAFNPWYPRQIGYIDQCGNWSVWNIEGQKRGRQNFTLASGKSGHVVSVDGLSEEDSSSSSAQVADGWGRVLWVGDVSTLCVCNRKQLAFYDLKSDPKALSAPTILKSTSKEWILDVKRSPVKLNQVFVLTTSRVFWIQVKSGTMTGESSATIILSQRHFRDAEHEKLRIESTAEDEVCLLFLYGAMSTLLNTLRFEQPQDPPSVPCCSMATFTLPAELNKRGNSGTDLLSLAVTAAPYFHNDHYNRSGPGMEYMERNIKFFLFYALSSDLAMSSILCATALMCPATSSKGKVYAQVQTPTEKSKQRTFARSFVRVQDEFIVPDTIADGEPLLSNVLASHRRFGHRRSGSSASHPPTVDARSIFRLAYPHSTANPLEASGEPAGLHDHTDSILRKIRARAEHGIQGSATALEMSAFTGFKGDIDEASSELKNVLFDGLEDMNDLESTLVIQTSMVDPYLLVEGLAKHFGGNVDLSDIYDSLVRSWVTPLPATVPGPARLAKERTARSVAVELYLSSIIVSLKETTTDIPTAIAIEAQEFLPAASQRIEFDSELFSSPLKGPLDSSPLKGALYSSPLKERPSSSLPSGVSTLGLPTPATTPSLSSAPLSTSSSSFGVDNAISRLRNYATSIKSQPPLRKAHASILAHWPANPGVDPSQYSWEATRKAIEGAEEDGNDEEVRLRRKEAERRRRRAEKYLKRQRDSAVGFSSQPQPVVTSGVGSLPTHPVGSRSQDAAVSWGAGSQPDPRLAFSSQPDVELPMTQPAVGTFGSRLPGGQSKTKRRRTKGF